MANVRLIKLLAIATPVTLALAACGGSGGSDGGSGGSDEEIGAIDFYSPETADMTDEIAAAFEDQVGGTVNVTSGGTSEIVNKLLAQQDNQQADVWYGGGGFMPFESAREKDLLTPYEPEVISDWDQFNGPIQMYQDDWYWVGADYFTLGIAYNPEVTSEADLPATWEELADPEWSGKIQLPNPAASGTATLFVMSQLMAQEDDEDAVWDYFDKLVDNANAIPDSGAGPTQAVAQGEAELGVAFEFMPYQLVEQRGVTMEFHVPENTPVLVNPIALIADGPNPEGGKRFIEWFLSTEGQQVRAEWQYLVTNDEVESQIPLEVSDVVGSAMDLDIEWINENYDEVRREWADRYGS